MTGTANENRAPAVRRISARQLAAASILLAGVCVVILTYALLIDDKDATTRDYIQYWAAEQQLVHGANPYDVQKILQLEQSRGLEGSSPKVTLSPPVAFIFALPLGYVSAKAGFIGWLVLLIFCAGLSMWILWFLHGRPDSRWHVLVFGFPPVLSCLMAGQLGTIFLLDFVLFLWLYKRHPWLAGGSLLFCALKPHLFLPSLLVLILYCVKRKDFRVIAGFVVTLAASCGLTMLLDPLIWGEYFAMVRSTRAMDVFIPTLSVALRFVVDRDAWWIEFLPEIAACLWAVWYFWTRRDRWEWRREGLLVLLVSTVCVPYSFFTDQAVVFPAILAGMYAAEKDRNSWLLLGLFSVVSLTGLMMSIQLPSPFYLWTALAWLVWYLYATRRESKGETTAPNPA